MSSAQTPCRVCTFNVPSAVNQAIKILEADNVVEVAIQVVTGPVILTGNFQFPNTANGGGPIPSSPISLATGSAFVFGSPGAQAPIDNLTIDGTGGSVNIVMKM